jgi:invasion protein IalB
MLKSLSSLFALCLLCAPAFAQQSSAPQTQNIETGDTGWQVICRNTTQDRTKMNCSVLQETFSVKDRVKLISIEFVRTDKGAAVVVSVPQGVNLKTGIEMAVDNANKITLAYSHCLNNVCIATGDLTSAQTMTLKKGKQIDISFADIQGAKVNTQTKLDGFVQAMGKADM